MGDTIDVTRNSMHENVIGLSNSKQTVKEVRPNNNKQQIQKNEKHIKRRKQYKEQPTKKF